MAIMVARSMAPLSRTSLRPAVRFLCAACGAESSMLHTSRTSCNEHAPCLPLEICSAILVRSELGVVSNACKRFGWNCTFSHVLIIRVQTSSL